MSLPANTRAANRVSVRLQERPEVERATHTQLLFAINAAKELRLRERQTAMMRLANLTVKMALLLGTLLARATEPSPVGYWTVFDDDTGKPAAIIEIQTQGGALIGWIDKILDPPKDSNSSRCTACEGELKNAPFIGLTIIQDMQLAGDTWHGYIMDPKSGKVYNATMSLADQGQELEVRGYIGIPLFGRSQIWERAK